MSCTVPEGTSQATSGEHTKRGKSERRLCIAHAGKRYAPVGSHPTGKDTPGRTWGTGGWSHHSQAPVEPTGEGPWVAPGGGWWEVPELGRGERWVSRQPGSIKGAMPAIVLTDAEEAEALAKGGADLKFLFQRNDVDTSTMAKWFHAGVRSLEKFANIAKDAEDLAVVMKEYLGIDQAASLEARVQAAALTCAWTNARTRVQRAAEVEAEMDTKDWVKPLVSSEWLAMKAGLEKVVGTLDEKTTPAKEYVEKKLQEVEAGDYRAEDLSEVVSREEIDPDSLVPQWDAKGHLTVRKGAARIKEPENPESLRMRLTVMRNAMQMIALKHTNRAELQGDYTKAFEEYKEYLLGEHVYGLNAKDADGLTIAAPPFRLVLAYEKAVRKEAMRRVNQEQTPFPRALKMGWKDPTTKERHFTTPLALSAKRPAQAVGQWAQEGPTSKKGKMDTKGSKGKSKGGGKQLHGCASHNKEGVPICYRYNTAGEKCKMKKCKFSHQCGICLSDKHPMFQCNASKRQPPDTGGKGL